jgi:WD40 repeat protein
LLKSPAASILGLFLALLLSAPARATEPHRPTSKRVDLHGDPLPSGAVARLGSARFRHAGGVSWARFSPDGKAIISVGVRGTVRWWDAASGKQMRRFSRAGWQAQAVAVSPDGARVVTHDIESGGVLRCWDTVRGQELPWFKGMTSSTPYEPWVLPSRPACSRDGRILLMQGYDDAGCWIQIQDAHTGKVLHRWRSSAEQRFGWACLSGNGKTLAIPIGVRDKETLTLWDAGTGQKRAEVPVGGYFHIAGFSPDGGLVAWQLGGALGQLRILDTATGKQRACLGTADEPVGLASFSPDGKRVAGAYGGRPGTTPDLVVWEVGSGKILRRFRVPWGMCSFAFSPDGNSLVSADPVGQVQLWDIDTGKELRRFPGRGACEHPVLAFSPDGKLLAVTGEMSPVLHVWDVTKGKKPRGPAGHQRPVWALAFSPDGQTVASMDTEGAARLWEARTGRPAGKFAAPPELYGRRSVIQVPPLLAFPPGGKGLWALCRPEGVAHYDLGTGKALRYFKHGTDIAEGQVYNFCLADDGKTLVTGGYDGTIRLWGLETGKELGRLPWDNAKVLEKTGLRVFSTLPGRKAVAVCWTEATPPGARPQVRLRVWELATGKERANFTRPAEARKAWATALPYSPDGRWLAIGSSDAIYLFDLLGGKETRRIAAANVLTETATFSPDGKLLAARTTDGGVCLWNVATGAGAGRVPADDGAVTCFAFSPDGRHLACGCDDTTVLVWDVAALRRKPAVP